LSAFFLYVVNILAFVNQPPCHIKAVIIAVFSILAVVFLLLGAFSEASGTRDAIPALFASVLMSSQGMLGH